jgi:hypothetical protein
MSNTQLGLGGRYLRLRGFKHGVVICYNLSSTGNGIVGAASLEPDKHLVTEIARNSVPVDDYTQIR